MYTVEEIYRTEGVPEYTFVKPPNFNEILVDIRNPGKPVIIEGQSGTGKTTAVKKIIERATGSGSTYRYLSARRAIDIPEIQKVAAGELLGTFIIDDFHRLTNETQIDLADRLKVAAEEGDPEKHPKVVIIGINKVGSELIELVPDIAKRCGIHRIAPATPERAVQLIERGEERLNVGISNKELLAGEARGDYWLLQLLCQTICMANDVIETLEEKRTLGYELHDIRARVVDRLDHTYEPAVKEFCRGKRFRATNDPYFKLLREIGRQDSSIVDLQALANSAEDVRGSINNIKESRLSILLDTKPSCGRHFYYNAETKNFAVEDPALFYFLKHLDWERLRQECGFRYTDKDYEFDIAISFAGENRELARHIADQIQMLDCAVFFDELYEANYLGTAWRKQFEDIFKNRSRVVVCVLDVHHADKIWPTFERECFTPRVADGAVIPIFLDNSVFPGIPADIVGIRFVRDESKSLEDQVTDEVAFKIVERLGAA